MLTVTLLGFAGTAYGLFLLVFADLILFLAGSGRPHGIDDGEPSAVWLAVCVDVGLLLLFALQHSVMARPWFKRRSQAIVPSSIERSTYVLAATVILALVIWQWRALPATVWSIDSEWLRMVLWVGYAAGWALVVFSSFLLGHLELFGLGQVLRRLEDREAPRSSFCEPALYRFVRHPLLLGFLVAFWSTPDMSAGRLLFAVVMTAYILVAVRFEERDLRHDLGEPYEDYQQRVPRFVPRSPRVGARSRSRGRVEAEA
jgi:protein-S-isoprenylcysteine O-methyltransferase Ste14